MNSIVDKIVEQLAHEIRTGGLQPRDKLDSEINLAQRFGTGRSSVREALRTLSSRGLIEIHAGRGSFVSTFEEPAVSSLYPLWHLRHDISFLSLFEVRIVIEPQIAALASRRIGEAMLEELNSTLVRLRTNIENDSLSGRVFADIGFHDCLVRAADNELFLSIYRSIEPMLFDIRRLGLSSTKRSEKVLKRHEQIFEAVRDCKPEEAKTSMLKHLLEFATDKQVEVPLEVRDLF